MFTRGLESQVQDDETEFDGDWVSLHRLVLDLGTAFLRLHSDLVRLHTSPVWIENRAAAGDVELPSMPGTAKDFALSPPPVFTGRSRKGHPLNCAKAKRRRLVGAYVAQSIVTTVDIEDANGSPFCFDDPAMSGRQLARWT